MKMKKLLAGALSFLTVMMTMGISAVSAQTTSADSFIDVPVTHPNYTAIMYLKNAAVLQGYPDGTYKPGQEVNRVEALKIILLGSKIAIPEIDPVAQKLNFKDALMQEWYAKYLVKGVELGIVNGYPDGNFRPTQTVNLVENLKMLANTRNIDTDVVSVTADPYADAYKDQWYSKYVQFAKNLNWIAADNKNMIYPANGVTRAKLAQLLYNSIKTTSNPNLADTFMDMKIEAMAFADANLTVEAGTTITWTNKDTVEHTVTSDDGKFASKALKPGQSFSYRFVDIGSFAYHCNLHPEMKAVVTVTAATQMSN